MKTLIINNLGIDASTRTAKKLIRELLRRKSTISASGPFMYHEENTTSQVHIETTLTESELDNWLYTVKHGADYVGVFTRGEA